MTENVAKSISYSENYPAKCCRTCVCFYGGVCNRIKALCPCRLDCAVSECGICSKWISGRTLDAYVSSSSFEEAKMKTAVMADGSFTDELDNMFCERFATEKMLTYMENILTYDPKLSENLSLAPLDPVLMDIVVDIGPEKHGILHFGISRAFWPVHEWLKQNEPIYREFVSDRRSYASRNSDVIRKFMRDTRFCLE